MKVVLLVVSAGKIMESFKVTTKVDPGSEFTRE
jgi:hypothetical protein